MGSSWEIKVLIRTRQEKGRGCLKFRVACENGHIILSHRTKCSSAKRKTEKLLNSKKSKQTMKVINFFKELILQPLCCYLWLLLLMPIILPTNLTNIFMSFSLAILPPYLLLLLFLAPFCLLHPFYNIRELQPGHCITQLEVEYCLLSEKSFPHPQ